MKALTTIKFIFALLLASSCQPSGNVWTTVIDYQILDGNKLSAELFYEDKYGYRLPSLDSFSYRDGNTIHWDFGDGQQYTQREIGEVVTHEYDEPGEYTVIATEYTKDGDIIRLVNGDTVKASVVIQIPTSDT